MKILLIDDDLEFINNLGKYLSFSGLAVKAFTSPYEAIALFKTEKFDAVVTDINMPEMSGIEILKAVRAYEPATYVIVMSGNSAKINQTMALNNGAFAFLSKPLDMEELIRTISKIKAELHRPPGDRSGFEVGARD